MARKRPTARAKSYTFEERIAGMQATRQRFQNPPGDELTRAVALGTWYSFFGDYRGCEKIVGLSESQLQTMRMHYAEIHQAATDYLIRLAATLGIDATPLHTAGALCRLLAKESCPIDPTADSHLWPDCLGAHRYQLPQGHQAVIEAGERTIQKLRLKLGHEPDTRWSKPDSPSEWAKVFGVKDRTFTRWVRYKKIRAKIIDSKNIMVDLRDMPARRR